MHTRFKLGSTNIVVSLSYKTPPIPPHAAWLKRT